MKTFRLVIIAILFGMGSLSAQSFVSNIKSPSKRNSIKNDQQIKILAVLVEFQEDRDNTTSGNGKFETLYSKDYGTDIIDPLPHDKKYFEDHLLFAKNYFAKVSNNKLQIEYDVLPEILTVSKRIREYSPPRDTNNYSGLTQFCQEAWSLADQQFNDLDFEEYDLFVVFHAGVGNDIAVPGSIGGEKDLPSVYLDLNTFQDYLGQDFEGFNVGDDFNITNTILLPETESREISTVVGTNLLELSINGLIVANIASYLGLPDLFDTNTGKSAIGRMGLMDGQAIFAYSGLFPPEPSAWEKIYLGWAEAEEITSNQSINLKARLANTNNENSIVKIPLNDHEYYLIENRQRDVDNNGIEIDYIHEGELKTFQLEKDTTGFYSYDTDTIKGVVVNVDEFDWALPGNGLLIWHIDESVIAEKIEVNKINADMDNRGVDLEEADGIQDIGEEYQTIFGSTVVGEGEKIDFWYSGNDGEFYENLFSVGTRPDTRSNNGSNSMISISDFSEPANEMSFKVKFGSENIKKTAHFKLDIENEINAFFTSINGDSYYVLDGKMLKKYSFNGELVYQKDDFSSFKPYRYVLENSEVVIGVYEKTINLLKFDEDDLIENSTEFDSEISTQFIDGTNGLIAGTIDGQIIKLSHSNQLDNLSVDVIAQIDQKVENLITNKEHLVAISENTIYYGENFINSLNVGNIKSASIINNELYYTVEDKLFHLDLLNGNNNEITEVSSTNFAIGSFDKTNSFAVTYNGSIINPVNKSSVTAEYFPYKNVNGSKFNYLPLIVDFNDDDITDVFAVDETGNLHAVNGKDGSEFDGFPISVGNIKDKTNIIFYRENEYYFASINELNEVAVWNFAEFAGKIYYGEYLNTDNSSSVEYEFSTTGGKGYFSENTAYNWPNPVYGNETNIRYYVGEDSDVTIKIFDMVGDYVAELTDKAIGGMDNETRWDVSNVESGVYYARLQVKSNSGKSATKLIKIAVVK